MPGETVTTEAVVLGRKPPADRFQTFSVFSPGHGPMLVLHRISKRPSSDQVTLDLFDEVSLVLETSNQGQTWFSKEARLLKRHTGIGQDYERLRRASAFAAIVARNPVPEDGRARIHALLQIAFSAFAASDRPEIVQFKSLYSLAKEEGYPLRQQWIPTLPVELRTLAERWLHTPLHELANDPRDLALADLLQGRLEHFLRHFTDLVMD